MTPPPVSCQVQTETFLETGALPAGRYRLLQQSTSGDLTLGPQQPQSFSTFQSSGSSLAQPLPAPILSQAVAFKGSMGQAPTGKLSPAPFHFRNEGSSLGEVFDDDNDHAPASQRRSRSGRHIESPISKPSCRNRSL